jgi:hypothetical protein
LRLRLYDSAFTLIFMVSAFVQESMRRYDQASWVNGSAATAMNSSAAASVCVMSGAITRY